MILLKSDLVEELAESLPHLTHRDVQVAVQKILGTIATELISGGRSEIRGFGTLSLNYRRPRVGRNPKTGEQISVPETYSVHFKPSRLLLAQVNQAKPKPS